MRKHQFFFMATTTALAAMFCALLLVTSCQDQQNTPDTQTVTMNYEKLPDVPKPEKWGMEMENPVYTYQNKGAKALIAVYKDSTTRAFIEFSDIQKEADGVRSASSSSCAGGDGMTCIRCGGKNVLCIRGIPPACNVMLESDGCMTIDCMGSGCPSYNICCSRYFGNR